MPKIFLVTSGCYSDCGVDGVFSTRELAEKYISLFPENSHYDMTVGEWELDEVLLFPPGKLFWEVEMETDGNVLEVVQVSPKYQDETLRPTGDDRSMESRCWATDEAHAVKIVNERRAQAIANGTWDTNWHRWREAENARQAAAKAAAE